MPSSKTPNIIALVNILLMGLITLFKCRLWWEASGKGMCGGNNGHRKEGMRSKQWKKKLKMHMNKYVTGSVNHNKVFHSLSLYSVNLLWLTELLKLKFFYFPTFLAYNHHNQNFWPTVITMEMCSMYLIAVQ